MKRWLLTSSLTVSAAALIVGAWLWFSLLSPWGYAPPAGLPPIAQQEEYRVFAYGTLRQPLVRRLVIGRRVAALPAILPDYRKQGLNLTPQPGVDTQGVMFVVSADELQRLDRYERLGIRYRRSRVELLSGTKAWVYFRMEE